MLTESTAVFNLHAGISGQEIVIVWLKLLSLASEQDSTACDGDIGQQQRMTHHGSSRSAHHSTFSSDDVRLMYDRTPCVVLKQGLQHHKPERKNVAWLWQAELMIFWQTNEHLSAGRQDVYEIVWACIWSVHSKCLSLTGVLDSAHVVASTQVQQLLRLFRLAWLGPLQGSVYEVKDKAGNVDMSQVLKVSYSAALLSNIKREWEIGRRLNSLAEPATALNGYMGTGAGIEKDGHFLGTS